MSAETAALLRAAREKIALPERWTQGEFARDVNGESLSHGFIDRAVCYCGYGAIESVSGDCISEHPDLVALLSYLVGKRFEKFNDHPTTTHADVLAVFDKAIVAEEAIP